MSVGMGRYLNGNRRVISVKSMNSKVSMEMRRCIQCARCVRYMLTIVGSRSLGMLGRGEQMEIERLTGKPSNIDGNVIDMCSSW